MAWALFPNIPGTVALWQLQGDLSDEANGYSLSLKTGATTPEAYAALGTTGLIGYAFDRGNVLWQHDPLIPGSVAALTALTGEVTIQLIARVTAGDTIVGNYTWTEFDPGNTMIWSFWYDHNAGTGVRYTNDFCGAVGGAMGVDTTLGEAVVWTFRRRFIGGTTYRVETFKNGVIGTSYFDTQMNAGCGLSSVTDNVIIGGDQFGRNMVGVIASVRILGYARTDAGVAQDYQYVISGGSADVTNVVYDAMAAAQFGIALRQNPRK